METLLQETLRLIKESGISPVKIAADCGLKHRWLYRLLDGDYGDPGVNKIETLNRYIRRQMGKAA